MLLKYVVSCAINIKEVFFSDEAGKFLVSEVFGKSFVIEKTLKMVTNI